MIIVGTAISFNYLYTRLYLIILSSW